MRNRVKEILNARGFLTVQLTTETLHRLFPKCPFQARFFQIWHNECAPMSEAEQEAVREWLELESVYELFKKDE